MEIRKPKALKKGDTIGLIAPCYTLPKEEAENAKITLEKLGYRVKYAKHLFSSAWGFAGTDRERAEDFRQMVLDDEVKMILFTGGEVSTHLLPLLDYQEIRRHPKIISSYSDSTTLLSAIYSQSGLVTFYGQSIHTFVTAEPYNIEAFEDRIVKGSTAYKQAMPWKVIRGGKAEGELIGGYLGNYALLQNTKYYHLDPEKQYLLFLEDHEKFIEPAAVSRYLSALEQDGIFEMVSGLIFGHYSDKKQPLIGEILKRIGRKYQIPVVWTEDFGHGTYNAIFPIGTKASLDADRKEFQFQESGVIL